MQQLVIGLTGLAGCGKSTASRILIDRHHFTRKPFAYPLKAMLQVLGVPGEILDGDRDAKEQPCDALLGMTVRHAAQTLGTEWGRRHMGEDFWVRIWMRGTARVPRIVADDVRFANEVQAIHKLGGVVIRIERGGSGSKTNASHASEKFEGVTPDFTIHNDGSLNNLEDQLNKVVSAITQGIAV